MRTIASAFFIAITLLINVALLTACVSARMEPTSGDAVVYVAAPLSGVQAGGGQSVLGGARLAAEEINRGGGLLGHRLIVRALDDEADVDVAVANVDKLQGALRRGERIVGVIGHLNNAPTAAALPLYEELGLLLITPAAGQRSLSHRGHTLFFRVNANDREQAAVAARFLVEQLRAQRVAIVYADSEYGRALAAGLIDSLNELDATVAAQLKLEFGQHELSHLLTQVREAAAEALFFAGDATEAARFRASLAEAGLDIPMLAGDGAFQTTTIDAAHGAAEGMYVSAFAPNPKTHADASWIKEYRALESRDPGAYSVNGYAALQALAAGVRAANSFQGDEIAEAMRAIEIDTLLGPLRFSANGDAVDSQVWIYRVEGAEFRQVE